MAKGISSRAASQRSLPGFYTINPRAKTVRVTLGHSIQPHPLLFDLLLCQLAEESAVKLLRAWTLAISKASCGNIQIMCLLVSAKEEKKSLLSFTVSGDFFKFIILLTINSMFSREAEVKKMSMIGSAPAPPIFSDQQILALARSFRSATSGHQGVDEAVRKG